MWLLEAFSPADAGSDSNVRLLTSSVPSPGKDYVYRTVQWHGSAQLFVCFGGKNKGAALTKQRTFHLVGL